jgi:hypothetical protein
MTHSDVSGASADLRTALDLRKSHSGDTTTDANSFGGLGRRIVGKQFAAMSLDDLVSAARRRLTRALDADR